MLEMLRVLELELEAIISLHPIGTASPQQRRSAQKMALDF
jgi:hypothetical protein